MGNNDEERMRTLLGWGKVHDWSTLKWQEGRTYQLQPMGNVRIGLIRLWAIKFYTATKMIRLPLVSSKQHFSMRR